MQQLWHACCITPPIFITTNFSKFQAPLPTSCSCSQPCQYNHLLNFHCVRSPLFGNTKIQNPKGKQKGASATAWSRPTATVRTPSSSTPINDDDHLQNLNVLPLGPPINHKLPVEFVPVLGLYLVIPFYLHSLLPRRIDPPPSPLNSPHPT